jgi:PAS domain S-box-containing protein
MIEPSVIPHRMIADLFERTGTQSDVLSEDASSVLLEDLLEWIEAEPARVVTDADGRVVRINPSFSQLCGFSFPEISGKKPGSLLQGPATTAESIEVLREAIRAKKSCQVEMVNYHKDKTPYNVRIELEPLSDTRGNHIGFQATEQKFS